MEPKLLGKLEQQVMDIIWINKTCSVHDVLREIQKKRTIAYTTVATILQRLCEKKILTRVNDKSHYIYKPRFTKQEYSGGLVNTFMKNIIQTFGDVAVASFVEGVEKLPSKEKNKLMKLLRKYEK